MASLPDQPTLEFHVRQVPRGQASGYAFTNLRVGAEVTVSGPLGNAYLRENHRGPLLALAGGSGLAPIKCIVEAALRADPARPIQCYVGVRDERDVYLETHLRELAQRHPNFRVEIVLSQPSAPTSRRTGTVSEAVSLDFVGLDGFKAYVAGPPAMVESAQRELVSKGLATRDIHADAFYSQAEDAFNLRAVFAPPPDQLRFRRGELSHLRIQVREFLFLERRDVDDLNVRRLLRRIECGGRHLRILRHGRDSEQTLLLG